MSKLSFALLAVYLIAIIALLADLHLLTVGCHQDRLRVAGRRILRADTGMTDQATDQLRRHLNHVISSPQPYALASGPITVQNVEVAIGSGHVYSRRAELP
jgi:hypothetical protein